MALLHHAQLTPSKLELVAGWLPSQPFFSADDADADLERVASFRFDDPAGEVGIETLLVEVGGTTLQIPLTYRGAPLEGADALLLGTMEHSVLGTRWVYDATGDPVYVAELVRTVVTGGSEVEQHYEENGVQVPKTGDAHVHGSGTADAGVPAVAATPESLELTSDVTTTTVTSDGISITIVRVPGSLDEAPEGGGTLLGEWSGMEGAPVVLAHLVHANA
ncbi:hypothetical protein GCM10027568_16620 [Humibacter soli]